MSNLKNLIEQFRKINRMTNYTFPTRSALYFKDENDVGLTIPTPYSITLKKLSKNLWGVEIAVNFAYRIYRSILVYFSTR